jgi:hypothetical protein
MINSNQTLEKYLLACSHELVRFYAYFAIAFLVPFSLGHPQELVGVIVNASLILGAIQLKSGKLVLPLLFAPSLAVLARGIIFGPFTPFLAVMLPFIWAGNAILVLIVRELYSKKKFNYGITLGAAAVAKSGFLFISAFALFSLSLLPEAFLASMGFMQLLTALVGGIVAFGVLKAGIARRVVSCAV